MTSFGLQGRHVLITGASGGIGTALTRIFAGDAGARVTAHCGSNLKAVQELSNELGEDVCRPVQFDVCDEESVFHSWRMAVEQHNNQEVDCVIINHGIFSSSASPAIEMSAERFRKTVDVNLTGSFLVAREFLRGLQRSSSTFESPNIIVIGSTAGKFGEAGHVDYASSKAALQTSFILSLKNEIVALHPGGRVNAIAPGWVLTPMSAPYLSDHPFYARALQTTPLKRLATPQDLAYAALSLASPVFARHITGQCIALDGGMEGRVLWKPEEIPKHPPR